MPRSISQIAAEIREDWKKIDPFANEYLKAMFSLDSIHDNYYFDPGVEIVLRFLCNAGSWRGETARRIKKELRDLAKQA